MKKKIFAFCILAAMLGTSALVSADTNSLQNEPKYLTWLSSQKAAASKDSALVSAGEKVKLSAGQSVSYKVTAPQDGLYRLSLDYLSTSDSLINPQFSLEINGNSPYFEAQNLSASTLWKNKSSKFLTNASGDDLVPEQVVDKKNNEIIVNDASFSQQNGLLFYFHAGENLLTLNLTAGSFELDQVKVLAGKQELPSYASYKSSVSGNIVNQLISFEAENTAYKDTSYAQPQRMKNAAVSPYSSQHQLFNVFGGDSWKDSGQGVTWSFKVAKTGLYTISLKNQQNNSGKPVFRQIALDGKIPFQELSAYRFDSNSGWTNSTLSAGKTNFQFYLTKGTHSLTMAATDAPLSADIARLDDSMKAINDLGLQIQKLTGNSSNSNYQWKIKDYIPDIDQQMSGWIAALTQSETSIEKLYGSQNSKAKELVQLKLVIKQLKDLAKDPNKLPSELTDLSQGSASVTNSLATIEQTLEAQPLTLDKFYLSSGKNLPSAKVSWTKQVTSTIAEFFSSFGQKSSPTSKKQKTLTVWVKRSQQYVDMMQSLADSEYTPKTGVKIDFQIMPDESKLLLAAASNEAPDAALGVSVGIPYNLALRGAVLKLNDLPGFKATAQQFSPGAMIPMVIDNNFYGLPETQDFYVQFTRNDVLNKLNVPAPNDWNDVTSSLPTLQRYGMNYYIPLSGVAGTKAMMFTAPFIWQAGGSLYSQNGRETAINSSASIQGLTFMTSLYNTYSLPLQVNSFYNSFRYGQLPAGISNFGTYVQLKAAAPEIANEWSIEPSPGTLQADGTVNRMQTGSHTEDLIFKSTKERDETWKFLQWWASTSTQTDYARQLQTTYGPSYMWNTANLKAFAQLPWPEADKKAILEQWNWLEEAPQTPAGYMEERQISNVWTDVVFSGKNVRAAVENNSLIINKEITSRLSDFGYIKNGKTAKNYEIPTLDKIKELLDEN